MSEPLDLEPIKARDAANYYTFTRSEGRALLAEVERLRDQCELLLAREVAAWDEGYSAGFHDVGYGDTANPILPFADSDGTSDEVERLRGEVARQAEQIAAVRAVVAESRRIARSRRIALSLSSNADILRALDGPS